MNPWDVLKALKDYLSGQNALVAYATEQFGKPLKGIIGMKISHDPGDYPFMSFFDVQSQLGAEIGVKAVINVGIHNDQEDEDGYIGTRQVLTVCQLLIEALMEDPTLGGRAYAIQPDMEILADVRMVHPFYSHGVLCEVKYRYREEEIWA